MQSTSQPDTQMTLKFFPTYITKNMIWANGEREEEASVAGAERGSREWKDAGSWKRLLEFLKSKPRGRRVKKSHEGDKGSKLCKATVYSHTIRIDMHSTVNTGLPIYNYEVLPLCY